MVDSNASAAVCPWLACYEPTVPAWLEFPKLSLGELLLEAAARWPQRPAILFGSRRLSYRALAEEARRLASVLRGLGVAKGDRVALFLPNCPEFSIGFFGILLAGGIAVPTSPLYTAREAELQWRNAGIQAVVAWRRLSPVLAEVDRAFPLPQVLTVDLPEAGPLSHVPAEETARFHRWELCLAEARPLAEPVAALPDELAVLQYTGGTTGISKGAMLTHANLVANCHQVNAWLGRHGEHAEVYLGAVPFFHIYGLTVVMLSAVSIGAAVVPLLRFDVEEVVRAIATHRPTIFHGVPTMYVALNRAAASSTVDFRCVEACISGSAPLPPSVQRRFEELTGGKLVEGYGLTEASPVTHINPLGGERKIGSIGLPLPNTQCKIVDPLDPERELPVGETGELVVRGPQVMQGYWQTLEESAAALRNGWLHTGDLACMDADGFFAIVNRKKDMILVSGLNVYPREVEEVLIEHPSIEEAVVIGVPDDYRGETVKAFVVPRDGARIDEEELRAFARTRLAPYKVFRILEVRPSMPKTAVGKVLRRLLRDGTA